MPNANDIELIHYSKSNRLDVVSKNQDDLAHNFKPFGLWVSVESDEFAWSHSCDSCDWSLGENAFEITLTPIANILYLATNDDLLSFTNEYNDHSQPYSLGLYIDWKRVADLFDGIIIAPYNWSLRLDTRTTWYYGWDCASGCIWNADAIAKTHRRQ